MNTILVIHPYFGSFPNIFPFWLESCKLNKTVDFLIVTDQDLNPQSQNIYVLKTTLEEVKSKIESLVGTTVWLERPYKLCDFRPLFGLLFSEYVSKYDFWGYCDCDLIFGNIRYFLTDKVLDNHDYIMGWGHFHVQRTIDAKFEDVWKSARGLWKDIGWKQVFKSNQNEWFDELPYGVSGRYFEMYPDRCWMGYADNHACFESPSASCLPFKSLFNVYKLWKTWKGFQQHLNRLPFLKRQAGNDIRSIIYSKESINLYVVGLNPQYEIRKTPILYAHFYKRKLNIHTNNLMRFIIRPNAIIEAKKINRFNLLFYAYHPNIYWEYIKYRVKRRYNNFKMS